MILLLAHLILSLRVIRNEGKQQVYKIPKKSFLVTNQIKIPAQVTEWTFKKDGKMKKYSFGENEMIGALQTGDYEVDLNFKYEMSPFYVVYEGDSDSLVHLFDENSGSIENDDLKNPLSNGFYIGNVDSKEREFTFEPQDAKLNVQLFSNDGKKNGNASDMESFKLPMNTVAFVKKATGGGSDVTKIKSGEFGNSVPVHYKYSSTDVFYQDEQGQTKKIEIVFDEKPDEKPNPGDEPSEPQNPEKPEEKTENPDVEEEKVEYSVENSDKKYVCSIGSKGTMIVKFKKPHGCFIPELGSFTSIVVQFFDGSKEVSRRTYENNKEKPLRFIDGGKYTMTITVKAPEEGFFAIAHSIPVSLRAVGFVSEYNLELEKGQTAEVYLQSSYDTNYTWEAKDAVLTEIEYANIRSAPQPLEEASARDVHRLVTATGEKGRVSFKNEGQKAGDFVWYTTNDTPKHQIVGERLTDVQIESKSNAGMIAGIVIGVVAVVAIVGIVVGLFVTKKACFANKIEQESP